MSYQPYSHPKSEMLTVVWKADNLSLDRFTEPAIEQSRCGSINSCQCIMLSEQKNEIDYILCIELLPPYTIPVISEHDLFKSDVNVTECFTLLESTVYIFQNKVITFL